MEGETAVQARPVTAIGIARAEDAARTEYAATEPSVQIRLDTVAEVARRNVRRNYTGSHQRLNRT